DLRFFLVADDDGLVAPRPDLVLPAGQPGHLLGQVAVEVGHEVGEFLGGVDPQQEVVMRGEAAEGHDLERMSALGASEDAEKDVVELLGRPQELAALDGAASDLDEGPAFGHETKMATHAQYQSENGSPFFHSGSKDLAAT